MSDVSETIKKEIEIRIMDKDAKARIRQVFDELEERLQVPDLGTVLATAILELVENAVKANLKRAFFKKHSINIHDPAAYKAGIIEFKKNFRTIPSLEYQQALIELQLKVAVAFDHNQERLLVFVENNSELLVEEERRIRRQLAAAMQTKGLETFYENYGDETEGAGMGLAMIVLLIRNLGFKPDHFRVFRQKTKTQARLEFPLSTNYLPIRERWQQNSPPMT